MKYQIIKESRIAQNALKEEGVYLALGVVLVLSITSFILLGGLSPAIYNSSKQVLHFHSDSICQRISTSYTTLPSEVVSIFRDEINSLVQSGGTIGHIELTGAKLIYPTMPEAGVSFNLFGIPTEDSTTFSTAGNRNISGTNFESIDPLYKCDDSAGFDCLLQTNVDWDNDNLNNPNTDRKIPFYNLTNRDHAGVAIGCELNAKIKGFWSNLF